VGALVQRDDLGAERAAAHDRGDPHAGGAAGVLKVARNLEAEFSGRDHDQRLDHGFARVDVLHDRDAEGEGLAGAGARLADQVDAAQRQRQAEGLDGEGVLDADPGQRRERRRGRTEVGEAVLLDGKG